PFYSRNGSTVKLKVCRFCTMIWSARVEILNSFLIACEVRHGRPEVFARERNVESRHIRLTCVGKHVIHSLPASDSIALLCRIQRDALARELIGDGCCVAASREHGIVPNIARLHAPLLAELKYSFSCDRCRPGQIRVQIVATVNPILVENDDAALAVRSE